MQERLSVAARAETRAAGFVEVRLGGKLAFKYDPVRELIEWQHRGQRWTVDLLRFRDEVTKE